MAANSTFDPFNQTLTLLDQNGNPIPITIPELDDFILYSVQISINYSAQLAASLILLVVLAIVTKPEKRKSPVFIFNCASQALNFGRNLMQCLYFTGPFSEVYAYFAFDYSRVPESAYAVSIAALICNMLLMVFVEASLMLQAQVVCMTLPKLHRQVILFTSLVIGSLALVFRLILTIENTKYILSLASPTSLYWLVSSTNIVTTVSICWFCAVFVLKLCFALYQRRKLGLRRFGPMQVLFIMGCNTLFIPALFSILQYVVDLPDMESNVLTLVAIFIPLSSIWAAATIDGTAAASNPPSTQRKFFGNSFKLRSTNPSAYSKSQASTVTHSSPMKDPFPEPDLEAQRSTQTAGRMDQTYNLTMRRS